MTRRPPSGRTVSPKPSNPVSVGLVSLGCAKNAVDLEIAAAALLKKGCTLAPDPDRCDVLVVNTCAFIASARAEAESEILRACGLKRLGAVGRVEVRGCYPQRYPERRPLFPDVDAWDGVPSKWECRRVPGLRFTGPAFAYLKIAEGCAHRCAYCAIPGIRGPYRSRPMKDILREAREFLATGAKELDVIAQDPMLYGVDLGLRDGLVRLLKAIDRLPGRFWVRVLYSYPSEISDAFLEWMRTSPHACRYVDVPVQHTDPDVLRRMARGSAAAATLAAAARIRAAVPGVTLRTTVMTGFPGETEKRFERLLADVKTMAFDRLGAFAFSPEEGTPAAKMSGRPSARVAEERLARVMAAQKRIWARRAKALVGRVFDALVVAPGVARLESQAPDVDGVVRLARPAAPGSFVRVRLDRARGFDFDGTVVR